MMDKKISSCDIKIDPGHRNDDDIFFWSITGYGSRAQVLNQAPLGQTSI